MKTVGALMACCLFIATPGSGAERGAIDFRDDFEAHEAGRLPGAPWKEETYRTNAQVTVDTVRAFSGKQALHIFNPRGANYRRGYVALHLARPLPQLQAGMFGRAMVWLDAAPVPASGATQPVHWTLLQGEGRSADNRYNSIYRLGVQGPDGTQLMANFETTPPVTTDCRQRSKHTLPVRRWACVEWRMDVASQEMQFWLDGRQVVRVKGRTEDARACRGNDLGGQWLAPPRFDSLYIGFERYTDSANDQNLWIDDVVLARQRVGCPAAPR